MKNKLLIFENEYDRVKTAFDAVNLLFYGKNLTFVNFTKSQDFEDFDSIKDYSFVLIDINLAKGSELDGYGIIEKVLAVDPQKPIIILTGNTAVEYNLEKKGYSHFPIIKKPVTFKRIHKKLQEATKTYGISLNPAF